MLQIKSRLNINFFAKVYEPSAEGKNDLKNLYEASLQKAYRNFCIAHGE